MGRRKRTETVDKTTVYFPESDLNKIDAKNRFRALRIAREIAVKAVSEQAAFMIYTENRAKMQNTDKFRIDIIDEDYDLFKNNS